MRKIGGQLKGDREFSDPIHISGMVVGNVSILSGGYLELTGMIIGNLSVESGARAKIRGMVDGIVFNQGGVVELYGVAERIIEKLPSAKTFIDPKAVVKQV